MLGTVQIGTQLLVFAFLGVRLVDAPQDEARVVELGLGHFLRAAHALELGSSRCRIVERLQICFMRRGNALPCPGIQQAYVRG